MTHSRPTFLPHKVLACGYIMLWMHEKPTADLFRNTQFDWCVVAVFGRVKFWYKKCNNFVDSMQSICNRIYQNDEMDLIEIQIWPINIQFSKTSTRNVSVCQPSASVSVSKWVGYSLFALLHIAHTQNKAVWSWNIDFRAASWPFHYLIEVFSLILGFCLLHFAIENFELATMQISGKLLGPENDIRLMRTHSQTKVSGEKPNKKKKHQKETEIDAGEEEGEAAWKMC